MAKTGPNVLIFGIAKRPERESLFKWVGTIAPVDYSFFAHKKSGLKRVRAEDARQLQVATTNGDVVDQLFKRLEHRVFSPWEGRAPMSRTSCLLAGRVDDAGRCNAARGPFSALGRSDGEGKVVYRRVQNWSEGMYVAFGGGMTFDAVYAVQVGA